MASLEFVNKQPIVVLQFINISPFTPSGKAVSAV